MEEASSASCYKKNRYGILVVVFWLRHVYSAVSNNWDLIRLLILHSSNFIVHSDATSSCASIIRSHASHGMHTTPKQTTWHSQNGDFILFQIFETAFFTEELTEEFTDNLKYPLSYSNCREYIWKVDANKNKQLNWTEPNRTDKNSGRRKVPRLILLSSSSYKTRNKNQRIKD